MSGLASRIFSPSTLSMRRSTPWVEGAAGPKLSSISWTSKSVLRRGRACRARGRGARLRPLGEVGGLVLLGLGDLLVAHETTFRFVSLGRGPPPSGYSSG